MLSRHFPVCAGSNTPEGHLITSLSSLFPFPCHAQRHARTHMHTRTYAHCCCCCCYTKHLTTPSTAAARFPVPHCPRPAVQECGVGLASAIMLLTLLASRASYVLLLQCAQLSGRRSYGGVASVALGRGGAALLDACVCALNLGSLVAFLDILAGGYGGVGGRPRCAAVSFLVLLYSCFVSSGMVF